MAENLARLKAKRGGNRGACTKLTREVEELFVAEYDENTITRCNTIKTLLEEKLKILNQLDEEILNICEIEDIENEIEESTEVTARILHVITKIDEFKRRNLNDQPANNENMSNEENTSSKENTSNTNAHGNHGATPQTPSAQNETMDDASGSTSQQSSTITNDGITNGQNTTTKPNENANGTNVDMDKETIQNDARNTQSIEPNIDAKQTCGSHVKTRTKLPRVSLPVFKGDIKLFKNFFDNFSSAVHSRSDLSKIDKFTYLVGILEGAAARSIEGLPITEENYDAAIEILQKRFGRPQQLISAHMDELLKLPNCEADCKPGQLRYIYDKLNVNIRALESLGVGSQHYGSLLIPIVMAKLPQDLRMQITRKTATEEAWKFGPMLEIIDKEIVARELSERVKSASTEKKYHRPTSTSTTTGLTGGTARTFLSNANYKTPAKTPPSCVFCAEKHYSASCEAVKNIEERKNILRRERRCFICLQKGHKQDSCEKSCRKCGLKHHQSICNQGNRDHPSNQNINQDNYNTSKKPAIEAFNSVESATVSHSVNVKSTKKVLLQTATAIASNPATGRNSRVRILFDTGSQRSYVSSNLSDKLKLNTKQREQLTLNTFGDTKSKKRDCKLVDICLKKSVNDEPVTVPVLTFPVICSPLSTNVNTSGLSFLAGLKLADEYDDGGKNDVDILIGADKYWDFVTGEIKRGPDGLIAVKSNLGWLLSGPIEASRITGSYLTHSNLVVDNSNNSTDGELREQLKLFWEVESLPVGIKDIDESMKRGSTFNTDIKFNNGRYEVKLPWKNDDVRPASSNYELCKNRLKGLYRRLKGNVELLMEYDNNIKQQLDDGIIEKSTEVIDNPQNGNVHFLPHLPVIRRDRETTKCRIVYDGGAKENQTHKSINDCLQIGPNLIPRTFDILTRFRLHSIGLIADIEKAFLNVGIQQEDRDFLRFLWFDDVFASKPKIIQYNFTRLVFGLRPSPAILGTTILHHLQIYQQSDPEMAKALSESLYVDDFITGTDSEEKAMEIYERTKDIMAQGGFNLRKWKSNSAVVQATINSSVPQTETKKSNGTEITNTKTNVLGMTWDLVSDELLYDFQDVCLYAKSLPITKRSILRVTAKLFDPLGLITPYTVRLKVLFQELCKNSEAHINWDDELQDELRNRWLSILNELQHLNLNKIPRCYFNGTPIQVCLHGFCDASKSAYAAVVYIRSVYGDGRIESRLVASKTRVAPIKKQSIPRLELLGALILARLANQLQSKLNINFTCLWTDSMTALYWIHNQRSWKQYVQTRVEEIRQLTDPRLWRHCPGELNPADLPSRGSKADSLISNSTWWKGPSFLSKAESEWPENLLSTTDQSEEILKEECKIKNSAHTLVSNSEERNMGIDCIIDCNKYSDLNKLLRVTAYVVKFINNIRNKLQKKTFERTLITGGVLTVFDLKQAETIWLLAIQRSSFKEEILYLLNGDTKQPIRVHQFGLYLDDDKLVRCKGRINNASMEHESKQPTLLPFGHYFVQLLITQEHSRIKHAGIKDTLTALRERYWILKGRAMVKRVLRKCVVCRRFNGISYASQPNVDLPENHVSHDPPFTHTGLDFCGPLYVINPETKSEDKAYCLLFTCASTRAVHLELTAKLNSKEFLLAFRRFAARRGLPATLQSDNAKTFVSVSKEIESIVRSPEVWKYLIDNQIKWDFIVEHAPWWGGYWERLVKSVKLPIKKVVGRSSLKYNELNTLLVEVEGILNARPITYVYSDDESISYPLTPSDLIYGRRVSNTPNCSHYEIVSTCDSLTKRVKHHRNLLRQFTRQWRKEYLTGLREYSAKANPGSRPTLHVGDIVILRDDSTKKSFWKLAKIEELLEGRDGRVRAATVRTVRGQGSGQATQVLRRPIQYLIPLEVNK